MMSGFFDGFLSQIFISEINEFVSRVIKINDFPDGCYIATKQICIIQFVVAGFFLVKCLSTKKMSHPLKSSSWWPSEKPTKKTHSLHANLHTLSQHENRLTRAQDWMGFNRHRNSENTRNFWNEPADVYRRVGYTRLSRVRKAARVTINPKLDNRIARVRADHTMPVRTRATENGDLCFVALLFPADRW